MCRRADAFTVEAGIDLAHTVVALAHDQWCAFVWELRSCFALLYDERIEVGRGSFGQLARWEPPLRAAFDGQAIYDIDEPAPILDAAGAPVDFARTFTLDDPDDEIADFLGRAGFVHLRGVMGADEIEALADRGGGGGRGARPDDRRSWWTTVDGREVCSRVNYINDQSAQVADLGTDERFVRIAALGGNDLRDAHDRLDGNGVVIKVPGATEGLVDLPWHRDCGMGGHPVKCPMLNVGIQLDPATAATGQLHMIAGSHRGTSRLPGTRRGGPSPGPSPSPPSPATSPCTSATRSMPRPARRPPGPRSRALYLSFVPPVTFEMVGPGQGYNDVLFTRRRRTRPPRRRAPIVT